MEEPGFQLKPEIIEDLAMEFAKQVTLAKFAEASARSTIDENLAPRHVGDFFKVLDLFRDELTRQNAKRKHGVGVG